MTHRLGSAVLTALLALGAACTSSDPPASAPASKAASGRGDAAAAEDEAVAHVIRACNAVLGNVDRDLVKAYVTRVGTEPPTGAPRMRPTNLNAVWDLGVKEATASLAAARQARPDLPLVADAEAMLARARDLAEVYRAAVRYYAAETWKDDGGSGAAGIHDAFAAAVDAYRAAQRKVAGALDLREQDALAAELARHPPGTISHWFRRMVVEGKILLRALGEDDGGAAFVAATTSFQAVAAELDPFCARTPEPAAFAGFCQNVLDNLAPRAARLARALGEPGGEAAALDADRAALVSHYNSMVQMANTLAGLEAQGIVR